MRDLNAYNCNKLYEDVEWSGPGIVGTLVVLAFVDIMVILGNVLVILAVYHTTKLRNVTNMFIVSLAVADLLVGVAVLPFSATWEVFKVWIFGDLWCSVWLAVDVWMCTASILNLCAISLDRYLAVTRPVSYPQIMSPKRAKLLVAAVWVLSFVICFPPLVGWKDQRSNPQRNDVSTLDDSGPYNKTRIILQPKPCPWICELTNDAGYVVYSALGSFYIPTLVMLFFYWRIYNAAVSTTKAINQGFRTTKGSKMLGSRFNEQRLTLRIHRGRGSVYNGGANNSNTSPKSPESNRSASVRKDKIKISVSYPSTETLNTKCNTLERTPSKCSQISVHYNSNGQTQSHLCPSARNTHLKVGGINRVGSSRRPSRRSSCESQVTGDEVSLRELTPGSEEKPRVMRMGKRNIKAQVKRFRMETKAAKTLGIIVGGFILCWLPFFTMYLVRAFCPNCIHPTVFSVLFWLGYCNSAINPCIYALFSKDFRFAFKRIICNCFCKRKKNSLRRGSDGSQLATRNDRSPNYSIRVPQHGVSIEDSDPEHNVHSGSDSR
ncbi:octopamine receptor Oamb-like isoform X1 [Microplitis mediator]|uniref:octopamine receptor Oamb-like isoform X1 n=1 Tax=Microplitis mediator TaxID=375433 RepID=UPI002554D2E7|nr:octopamine receptor Oamb-like isoform X1 [Microplitis mediator]XP_057336876.1 octopamine receptor Oamb-like isoform X1 [Microplitis mediator]XP_057336877.1 octopamine receptor Oamb-like isoform X1 [Microplitis mediator]XP_057336878.1 octopamine receptor Oamb-like isoform X1 [Microplitis mediator]